MQDAAVFAAVAKLGAIAVIAIAIATVLVCLQVREGRKEVRRLGVTNRGTRLRPPSTLLQMCRFLEDPDCIPIDTSSD